jgi:hypothetical protein
MMSIVAHLSIPGFLGSAGGFLGSAVGFLQFVGHDTPKRACCHLRALRRQAYGTIQATVQTQPISNDLLIQI